MRVGRGLVEQAVLEEANNWPVDIFFTNEQNSRGALIVKLRRPTDGEERRLFITPGDNQRCKVDAVRSLRRICRDVLELKSFKDVEADQRREANRKRYIEEREARKASAFKPEDAAKKLAEKFKVTGDQGMTEQPYINGEVRQPDDKQVPNATPIKKTRGSPKGSKKNHMTVREIAAMVVEMERRSDKFDPNEGIIEYKAGENDKTVFEAGASDRMKEKSESGTEWFETFVKQRKRSIALTPDEKERRDGWGKGPKTLSRKLAAKDEVINNLERRLAQLEELMTRPQGDQ